MAGGVLAAVDAQALEVEAVVVDVDVLEVGDAVVFEVGLADMYLKERRSGQDLGPKQM